MATTTATSVAAPFNKEPLFFCAPGPKDGASDQVKSSFPTQSGGTSLASPVPWPQAARLRVKFLAGHTTFPIVENIIKEAAKNWMEAAGDSGWTFEWVTSGDAEIRISFQNDVPNWSAWGSRAVTYPQSQATMNFCFGGWKDGRTVFSQQHIRRMALHLLGHALGLPHAATKWSSPWNSAKLEEQCGSFFAKVAQVNVGDSNLTASDSIMHFDRPAALGTVGSGDEKRGQGARIDNESIRLVQKLYRREPMTKRVIASQVSGWRSFVGSPNNQVPPAVQWVSTTATTKGVIGVSKIDMGLNGNFRLDTCFQNVAQKQGFDVVVKTWWDTHLIDASCDVLTFEQEDERVQVGRVDYMDLWPNGRALVRDPGVTLSHCVQFNRPFESIPKVVVFISCFDSIKDKYIRLDVYPTEITRYNFRLNIRTWADTILYNAGATWLAHEADDPTIRSGIFDNPFRPNWSTAEDTWVEFSSPLRQKPRYVFAAFSYIDTHPFKNIRLAFDVPDWNERAIRGRLYTWLDESKFNQLKGSYIVVL